MVVCKHSLKECKTVIQNKREKKQKKVKDMMPPH